MNRRDFLKTIGLASLAANSPATTAPRATDRDPGWHLLNRAGFGPRPGALEAVQQLGAAVYLDQQLQPETIDDSFVDGLLSHYSTLAMTAGDLLSAKTKGTEPVYELDSATVLRAVYSQRQLQQVMVNFWSDHFSLWHEKGLCRVLVTADNRDVIGANALGKFRDLLFASAQSPAMLVYLDNYLSDKQHPNENYAREVLELHTLGSGHYTENDVQELARCFTGWTIDLRPDAANRTGFLFSPDLHDDGHKTVLGRLIPAGGGVDDAKIVLEMLVTHPATARHIATKLCRRFIQDDPPDAIVDTVASTYLQSDGDIRAMLRTIFAAPEFWNAPPKFKRPFEFLMSLFRAIDADVQPLGGNDANGKPSKAIGLAPLLVLSTLDQLPFNHESPDGYSDVAAGWDGNLLDRWNVVNQTVSGLLPGVHIDLARLAAGLPGTPGRAADPLAMAAALGRYLYGRPLFDSELASLAQYLDQRGGSSATALTDVCILLASAPGFMFR